jgi:hypothetical protein
MEKLIRAIKSGLTTEVRYIIGLFVSSRIALSIIGWLSQMIIGHVKAANISSAEWIYKNLFSIWCQWDCGWYNGIARVWYSATLNNGNQTPYGFFPLYPALIKVFGYIFGSSLSALILANIFFLVACIFLYKLVLRDEKNKQIALGSIKYMVVFPTAFLFSGGLTESLFIMLVLMGFYYARENKWFIAGVCGLLFALTKHIGILAIIPLLVEYMSQKKWKLDEIRPDILWLLLIPLGTAVFAAYCYFLTGDFLAFLHIQVSGWGHDVTNPINVLWQSFSSSDVYLFSHALLVTVALIFLCWNFKKVRLSYWIFGLIYICVILGSGLVTMYGALRYLLIVFPFFIICAKVVHQKKRLDDYLFLAMALLQGFLMVFWSTGSYMVI